MTGDNIDLSFGKSSQTYENKSIFVTLCHIRYADNTVLIADSEKKLQEIRIQCEQTGD